MEAILPHITKTPLNPFEQEGVRVAETYIDGNVMLILKELFKDMYHGYIAPRMFSPFHTKNTSHEEIVIFDPINADLQVTAEPPKIGKPTPIQEALSSTYRSIIMSHNDLKRKIFMKGGEYSPTLKYQDRNAFFEDPQYKTAVKNATKIAKSFTPIKPINLHLKKEPVIPLPQHLKTMEPFLPIYGDC
jgi:hypothetical protein